ncbi:MAG: type II toxin-antitoxin system HicB family antitoxin [Candidatus Paceibacterota bacterium]
MNYKFTIITTKEKGGFVIRCAELGVVSQGKTVKEAQKNIKEAVELYLEDNPESKKYLSKTEPLISTLELEYA